MSSSYPVVSEFRTPTSSHLCLLLPVRSVAHISASARSAQLLTSLPLLSPPSCSHFSAKAAHRAYAHFLTSIRPFTHICTPSCSHFSARLLMFRVESVLSFRGLRAAESKKLREIRRRELVDNFPSRPVRSLAHISAALWSNRHQLGVSARETKALRPKNHLKCGASANLLIRLMNRAVWWRLLRNAAFLRVEKSVCQTHSLALPCSGGEDSGVSLGFSGKTCGASLFYSMFSMVAAARFLTSCRIAWPTRAEGEKALSGLPPFSHICRIDGLSQFSVPATDYRHRAEPVIGTLHHAELRGPPGARAGSRRLRAQAWMP